MTYKIKITEAHIKQQVKNILDIRHIFHYHLLQGIGSFKGVPDRTIHYEGKVIYLEIKKPDGKLTPAQELFKAQCEADNIPYFVIRSTEDLEAVVGEL